MTGACIIDSLDIASIDMFIERGGDSELLLFPSTREPDQNKWFESDGAEVDYDTISLKPKPVKINYYLSANDKTAFQSSLNTFKELHFQPGLRQIYLREFDKTFSLRFSKINNFSTWGGLEKQGRKRARIAVEYYDDSPAAMFNKNGILSGKGSTFVLLNGIDFGKYGIIIREVYNTALTIKSPKTGLIREFAKMDGAITDTLFLPKKESRNISIDCTLLASTLEEFWINYSKLFSVLTSNLPFTLSLANSEEIICYYVAMQNIVKRRPFREKIKLDFTLKINEV